MKELFVFGHTLIINESHDYQLYLANILIYFLYFEFIAMIIKYFKEDYHFPLRYFLYIGITAMVRLIIVDHDNPVNTLFYSLVILILIIGYFIMNITPREQPDGKGLFKKQWRKLIAMYPSVFGWDEFSIFDHEILELQCMFLKLKNSKELGSEISRNLALCHF